MELCIRQPMKSPSSHLASSRDHRREEGTKYMEFFLTKKELFQAALSRDHEQRPGTEKIRNPIFRCTFSQPQIAKRIEYECMPGRLCSSLRLVLYLVQRCSFSMILLLCRLCYEIQDQINLNIIFCQIFH
jgi:hypothetical protein